jgi:nucleotide-binding universal stress UspA family protein
MDLWLMVALRAIEVDGPTAGRSVVGSLPLRVRAFHSIPEFRPLVVEGNSAGGKATDGPWCTGYVCCTLRRTSHLEVEAMRILLAYDGSEAAQTACDLLAHLRLAPGTQLAVATVIDAPETDIGVSDLPIHRRDADERERDLEQRVDLDLTRVAAALRAPDRNTETRILHGRPASALIEEAERWNADLIVAGNRGHGPLESMLLGSTSAEVVDHAPCPVLVARHPGVHRLVIGVDGSESAERAVATLVDWSLLRRVPASVVGVLEPVTAWDFAAGGSTPEVVEMRIEAQHERGRQLATHVDEAVGTLRRAGGLADGQVREGDPADQLIRAASERGADLVVVGTRGVHGLGRLFLGSVARNVLLHASASVLVVRSPRERVEARQAATALAGV